jgi:starch synthase
MYHQPVPGLRVVQVAAEAYPFAKVGGLSDVVGGLSAALDRLGAQVTLIFPRYRSVDPQALGLERIDVPADTRVALGNAQHGFGLWRGTFPNSGAAAIFIEHNDFFDRFSVYNAEGGLPFADDAERWLFYQLACLEVCRLLDLRPDVIHGHDSQTGMVLAYLRTRHRPDDPTFGNTAAVYSIHNAAYQGSYGLDALRIAGYSDDWLNPGSPLEAYGAFNWMKAGISFADAITTVSPTYAREIQAPERGHGLDGLLRARRGRLFGILNGIDAAVWNPQRDPRIPARYGPGDRAGKRANKRALFLRLGLPEERLDAPLLAFVGRLVPQKGCDLFSGLLDDVLQHDVSFVALGSGANEYEDALRAQEARHPDKVRAVIGFDDALAHWIEAAADIFLMPSRYEPCGLNQMYSMAYGAVPVVHATGGLADTVIEVPPGMEEHGGTGFRFETFSAHELKEAVYRALAAFQDPERWPTLVLNGMRQDFSWDAQARRYLDVYAHAQERVAARRGDTP